MDPGTGDMEKQLEAGAGGPEQDAADTRARRRYLVPRIVLGVVLVLAACVLLISLYFYLARADSADPQEQLILGDRIREMYDSVLEMMRPVQEPPPPPPPQVAVLAAEPAQITLLDTLSGMSLRSKVIAGVVAAVVVVLLITVVVIAGVALGRRSTKLVPPVVPTTKTPTTKTPTVDATPEELPPSAISIDPPSAFSDWLLWIALLVYYPFALFMAIYAAVKGEPVWGLGFVGWMLGIYPAFLVYRFLCRRICSLQLFCARVMFFYPTRSVAWRRFLACVFGIIWLLLLPFIIAHVVLMMLREAVLQVAFTIFRSDVRSAKELWDAFSEFKDFLILGYSIFTGRLHRYLEEFSKAVNDHFHWKCHIDWQDHFKLDSDAKQPPVDPNPLALVKYSK